MSTVCVGHIAQQTRTHMRTHKTNTHAHAHTQSVRNAPRHCWHIVGHWSRNGAILRAHSLATARKRHADVDGQIGRVIRVSRMLSTRLKSMLDVARSVNSVSVPSWPGGWRLHAFHNYEQLLRAVCVCVCWCVCCAAEKHFAGQCQLDR